MTAPAGRHARPGRPSGPRVPFTTIRIPVARRERPRDLGVLAGYAEGCECTIGNDMSLAKVAIMDCAVHGYVPPAPSWFERLRESDLAADVRWYAAKAGRAVRRALRQVAAWRRRRDDDNDVPRPGERDDCLHQRLSIAPRPGPGHFGRPHISGTVHDEPAWYQPHAAPDIPQGFWSPPALRDWLPELLEWALTAPLSELAAAATA